MLRAKYLGDSFGTINSLASALGVGVEALVSISTRSDTYYYLHERRLKSDGSVREIHAVQEPLKGILNRVNKIFFRGTRFPDYIHSAKHPDNPRSHITNAETHIGAKDGFNFDVSNFFPSITISHVFDLWYRFYRLPRNVAWIMAKLCTYDGRLVQGAPTSSGVGNLIFWEREPEIVNKLRQEGFRYSRFVDDVTVSTTRRVRNDRWNTAFQEIIGMFRSKNVKLNRGKTRRLSGKCPIYVTGTNINADRPTYGKEKRQNIRAAVKQCERNFTTEKQSPEYARLWRSTWGRVADLCRLHPQEGKRLKRRLTGIKPSVLSSESTYRVKHASSNQAPLHRD